MLGWSIAHEAAHLASRMLRGQVLGFLAFQSLNVNIFNNAFNNVFLIVFYENLTNFNLIEWKF